MTQTNKLLGNHCSGFHSKWICTKELETTFQTKRILVNIYRHFITPVLVQGRFSAIPSALLTAKHVALKRKKDAATLWTEDITKNVVSDMHPGTAEF